MYRRLLLLATAVALAACAPAAEDTTADEEKLRGDAGVWFDRYTQGDAEGVANLYAEDAVVLAPGTPAVSGRAAIRDYIASDIENARAQGITLRNGEVTGVGVSGDLAWMTGSFTVADATGNTVDSGKYLSLYRRENGEWLLIRDVWNADSAPAAAAAPATTTTM